MRRFAAVDALPPSRPMSVRAGDGTALHAEVFGPKTAIRSCWRTASPAPSGVGVSDRRSGPDYRVIAYDHRGHGRSGVPTRRANYGLNYLAADLDAVLEATLEPGERAVIAGHSMGGIAISSWSSGIPAGSPTAPTPSL